MDLTDRAYMHEPRTPKPRKGARATSNGARKAPEPRIMTVLRSVVSMFG
jgi:hypothetical protein